MGIPKCREKLTIVLGKPPRHMDCYANAYMYTCIWLSQPTFVHLIQFSYIPYILVCWSITISFFFFFLIYISFPFLAGTSQEGRCCREMRVGMLH